MSEESKYYTPNPFELHYGFEIEYSRSLQGDWVEATYNERKGLLGPAGKHVDKDEIRVKYLDNDDFNEVGYTLFKRTKEENNRTEYLKRELKNGRTALINYDYGTKEMLIISKDMNEKDSKEFEFHFKGKVKNISELKRILHMCGIFENPKK